MKANKLFFLAAMGGLVVTYENLSDYPLPVEWDKRTSGGEIMESPLPFPGDFPDWDLFPYRPVSAGRDDGYAIVE